MHNASLNAIKLKIFEGITYIRIIKLHIYAPKTLMQIRMNI